MHKSKRECGRQVCASDHVNDGARVGKPRERLFYRVTPGSRDETAYR